METPLSGFHALGGSSNGEDAGSGGGVGAVAKCEREPARGRIPFLYIRHCRAPEMRKGNQLALIPLG